jgi:hypothetical protein
MSELIRVDPRWPGAWDALQGFLRSALERGNGNKDWSLEDIREAAIGDRVALWGLVGNNHVYGAGVTTMTQYPQRRVLEVLALGCERDTEEQWLPLLEHLRDLARALGCSAILGTGRPGWARKLGAEERRVFEVEV